MYLRRAVDRFKNVVDTDRLSLFAVLAFLLFLVCTFLFVVIAESWMGQESLYRLDQGVYYLVANHLQPVQLAAAYIVTMMGDVIAALVIALLLAGVLIWKRYWRDLAAVALVVGVGQGLLYSLKIIFSRLRPAGPLTDAQSVAESFPSGHTFTATVLYGLLIVLVFRHTDKPALRVGTAVLGTGLIIAVGVSRVLLSVHWMTDVMGGWMIGLAWLACCILLVDLSKRHGPHRQ